MKKQTQTMNKVAETSPNPSPKTSATWIKAIPNALTLLNLLSGVTAILLTLRGQIELSGLFFIACLLLDFADGLTAKLLHATSETGKQLDSLADLVSFGVYPGMAMFVTLEATVGSNTLWPFLAFLIPAAGALRLAIFNTEEQTSDYFKGLPIPAAAIGFISIAILADRALTGTNFYEILTSPSLSIIAIALFSFLMVSKLPMLSFKLNNLKWEENKFRIIFFLLVIIAFIGGKLVVLPFLIPFYIVYSLLFVRTKR